MRKESIIAAALSFAMALGTAPVNAGAFSYATDTELFTAETVYELGDVDGNGKVDANDASSVLSEYSRLSTGGKASFSAEVMAAADVDGNGKTDANDASLILSYYSYLSTGGTLSFRDYLDGAEDPPLTTTTTVVTTTVTKATTAATKATAAATTAATKATTAAATTAATKATTAAATTAATKATTAATTAATKATTAAATTAATKATTAAATTAATKATTAAATTAATKATTAAATTTATTAAATTTATKATTAATTSTTTITTAATTSTAAVTTTADPSKVSSIKLSRTEMSVNAGEGQLSAYVTMFPLTAADQSEIWSSSDESIAIVDGEGWVIGKSEGECVITVKSADNPEVSAEIKVTVTDTSKVRDIRLSRTSMTLLVNTGALSAEVTMLPTTASDKHEIWSSSDESIAIVDSEGWVIGKSAGTCTITVQSASNPDVKAEISVTVYDDAASSTQTTTTETETTTTTTTTAITDKVTEIQLSIYEMELTVGGHGISYVTMLPASAPDKSEIWSSSNEAVAIVDGEGYVTALSEGECVITVKSADNPEVYAEIKVTVTNQNRVREIVLSDYELEIELGQLGISWVTMLPDTAVNKGEIWVCSDENIASVDQNGWIYGRRLGECTVTVYSADNPSVKAEIKVTIVPHSEEPEPEAPESYIVESSEERISFCTPFPEKAKGSFSIEYVITDSNGKVSSIKTSSLDVSIIKSFTTYLKADTNTFEVTSYLTNTDTGERARIGLYNFTMGSSKFTVQIEDIHYAFYLLDGLDA